MKKIVGLLMFMAVVLVGMPVVSVAGDVTVLEAKYGTNCGAPGTVCVDVMSQLQAICDAQKSGCKTKELGTNEKFGQSNSGGLYAKVKCKSGAEESSDSAVATCMLACGAKTPCAR